MKPLQITTNKLLYYQGQLFDRPCVLKFLLSVEDTCGWVRDDLDVALPLNDPCGCFMHRGKYVPDMLIRNWVTGKAELIQVVPAGFDDYEWLASMQSLVRAYCTVHGLDWHYRVVFEEDIDFTDEQQRRFIKLSDDGRARILEFSCLLYQNDSGLSDAQYDCFVRTGFLPAFVP